MKKQNSNMFPLSPTSSSNTPSKFHSKHPGRQPCPPIVLNILKPDSEDQQARLHLSKSPTPPSLSDQKQLKIITMTDQQRELQKMKLLLQEQQSISEAKTRTLNNEIQSLYYQKNEFISSNSTKILGKDKQKQELTKQLQDSQNEIKDLQKNNEKLVLEHNQINDRINSERLEIFQIKEEILLLKDDLKRSNINQEAKNQENDLLKKQILLLNKNAQLEQEKNKQSLIVSNQQIETTNSLKEEVRNYETKIQEMKQLFKRKIDKINESHQQEISTLKQRYVVQLERQNEYLKILPPEDVTNQNSQNQLEINLWKEKYMAQEASFRAELQKQRHWKQRNLESEEIISKIDHLEQIIIFLKQEVYNKELHHNLESIEGSNYDLNVKYNQSNERLSFFQKRFQRILQPNHDLWINQELMILQQSIEDLAKNEDRTYDELKYLLINCKKELLFMYEIMHSYTTCDDKVKPDQNLQNYDSTISTIDNQVSKQTIPQKSVFSSTQSNFI